jgi:hypothetical protein
MHSRSPVFSIIMLALLHGLLQFFVVIGQQSIKSRGAFRR